MRAFHAATSMSALRESVCGVCARRLNSQEYEIKAFPIDEIPNLHRLVPQNAHPNHTLYNGALLEPEGVDSDNQSRTMVNVCIDCLKPLQARAECIPRLSLAAGLWVGTAPIELNSLTLPEALLIANIYPWTFVCKL
jgi:hypothetical protein